MRVLCKILGHDWQYAGDMCNKCARCKLRATDGVRFGKVDRNGK